MPKCQQSLPLVRATKPNPNEDFLRSLTFGFLDVRTAALCAGNDIVVSSLRSALSSYERDPKFDAREFASKCYNMGEFLREIAKYQPSEEFYFKAEAMQRSMVELKQSPFLCRIFFLSFFLFFSFFRSPI